MLAVARPPEFGDEVETEAVVENARWHYDRVLGPVKARLAGETILGVAHDLFGRVTGRDMKGGNMRSITSWSATAATRCSSAG